MNKQTNIPQGYKDSPLGVIPQEWEVKRLGEICYNISSGKNKTKNHYGKYPVYGSTGIIGYSDDFVYVKHAILVARVGANAGTINIADGLYDVSDNTLIVSNKDCYNFKFAYNQLLYFNVNKLVFGSGQPLVTAGQLKSIHLAIPPLAEQKQIAEVLGCWDEAIERQAKIVVLLETRKRALMQRLLTPKPHLSSNSSLWQTVDFETAFTVLNVKKYQIQKSEYKEVGKYPVVDQGQDFIIGFSDKDKCFTNSPVIIFGDHTRIIKWVDFNFIVGADGIQCIHTKTNVDIKFGYYLLCNTTIPNLGYSRHMRELKQKYFDIPSLPEQKSIAEKLSTADAEIDLAKRRLDLLRTQKRALMQQLLTGKKRMKI